MHTLVHYTLVYITLVYYILGLQSLIDHTDNRRYKNDNKKIYMKKQQYLDKMCIHGYASKMKYTLKNASICLPILFVL